uniref:Uncharacterized protein n=1 Tax=Rhizophora mucronata TaxID=61149 RepID=A0A2P2IT85_RHIMU
MTLFGGNGFQMIIISSIQTLPRSVYFMILSLITQKELASILHLILSTRLPKR